MGLIVGQELLVVALPKKKAVEAAPEAVIPPETVAPEETSSTESNEPTI